MTSGMNYQKMIVCLANSRKPGGRCVTGKLVENGAYGGWIRPVSARPGAEISLQERQYQDGTEPDVFDIIDIPMIASCSSRPPDREPHDRRPLLLVEARRTGLG